MPELVKGIGYRKGPYFANEGDCWVLLGKVILLSAIRRSQGGNIII